jgi:hypothetical protein
VFPGFELYPWPAAAEAGLLFSGVTARLEQLAEKVESVTSAAKAADGNKGFIAALKRCATKNQTFSAAC